MNDDFCCKCSKIMNTSYAKLEFYITPNFSRRMNIIDNYFVLCKMKNEVDEIKFKEFGIGAKLLYEVPDDCPFKLEHIIYDSTERDKDLEKFRIKKYE